MQDGFHFSFKIWRPCQRKQRQNSKWDASVLTEVVIVLSLYLLIMHMIRRTRKSKESGGAIGLTENPQMLERWTVAGPELCRVVEEFEGVLNELDELPHHQEGRASQTRFLSHLRDLIDVILMNINPFEEQLRGIVTLGDKVCESPVSAHSVYFIESTGKEQFKTYQESILHSRKIALTAPIKRNKLAYKCIKTQK